MANKKLLFFLGYFGIPIIPIIMILVTAPESFDSPLRYLGAIAGIFSYSFICFEFILTARPSPIERIFGQDKIILFHIGMSLIAGLFAAMHAGMTMNSGNFPSSSMASISGNMILVGFVLLMILGALFLSRTPKPGKTLAMSYNFSIFIHNFSILLAIWLWGHVFNAEATRKFAGLLIAYTIMIACAVGFWIYHKFIRIAVLKKHPLRVSSIEKESRDIWTLYLKPIKGKVFDFKPGQYGYIRIEQKGFKKELHPFSFSSSSADKETLTITIKDLGDYTSQIGEVQVGTEVLVDGPYGTFFPTESKQDEIVLIAGGVGITPFLSTIQYLAEIDPNRKVTMIYGMRTQSDFIREQFFKDAGEKMPNLNYVPVLSEDDEWAGECGFIDQPRLEKFAACEDVEPDNQTKEYFICGPHVMFKKIHKSLKEMKVGKKFIHFERF